MTLGQKQTLFTRCFSRLQAYAIALAEDPGYQEFDEVRLEEVARDQRATWGHPQSVHKKRLAGHLLLFLDGAYLTTDENYEVLGTYWKSLNPLCRWGGDFPGDGNHFSLEHLGIK